MLEGDDVSLLSLPGPADTAKVFYTDLILDYTDHFDEWEPVSSPVLR